MSRAKIAPTLQAFIPRLAYRTELERVVNAKALRELKALLAVATAARRVARDWDHWDEATPETCKAFHRALARLERASRRTP